MKKPFYRISERGGVTTFDGSALASLQGAVGGYITTAPITSLGLVPRNVTAYANDEGLHLAYNERASFICGYPLYGPVVIRATAKVTAKLQEVFGVEVFGV